MKFDVITLEYMHGTFTRIMGTTVGLFAAEKQEELMNRLVPYPFEPSLENFLHFGDNQTVIYLVFKMEENDHRIGEIIDIIEDVTPIHKYKED